MDQRELKPADYTAAEVAALLGLEPLPEEGGFFRRTVESVPCADAEPPSVPASLTDFGTVLIPDCVQVGTISGGPCAPAQGYSSA